MTTVGPVDDRARRVFAGDDSLDDYLHRTGLPDPVEVVPGHSRRVQIGIGDAGALVHRVHAKKVVDAAVAVTGRAVAIVRADVLFEQHALAAGVEVDGQDDDRGSGGFRPLQHHFGG